MTITAINAQEQSAGTPIHIAYIKTTNMVFPKNIAGVDRGSSDLLVQKAKGAENILQLKAATENFTETNLSVITTDGKLYSFLVNYKHTPQSLNFVIPETAAVSTSANIAAGYTNEGLLKKNAEKVMNHQKNKTIAKNKKHKMMLALNGLYIQDDLLYFRLELSNYSHIGYNIDQLRFFIRDQKKQSERPRRKRSLFLY